MISRPCDYLERWFTREDQRTTIVGVSTIESQDPQQNLKQEIVHKAAQLVSKRYPTLHANIYTDPVDSTKKWLIDEKIAEKVIVETKVLKELSEWEALAEVLINTCKFKHNDGLPLWRVLICNVEAAPHVQKLMIISDHMATDGSSVMRITHDLLDWTHKLMTSSANFEAEMQRIESKPMFKKPKELLIAESDLTPEESEFIEKTAKEMFEDELQPMDFQIPFDFDVSADSSKEKENRCNGLICKKGTQEGLKNLTTFCKKRGFTVGNVLAAACMQAGASLSSTIKERKGQKADPVTIEIFMDVNIRKRTVPNLPDDTVGLLISTINPETEITPSSTFIELCNTMKQDMDKRLNVDKEHQYSTYILEQIMMLEDKHPEISEVALMKNQQRYGDMELSNVGRYPFPLQHGNLTLKDYFTTATYSPEGWTFSILVNTVDTVCYTLIYEKTLHKRETAELLLNYIMKLVEETPSELTSAELVKSV